MKLCLSGHEYKYAVEQIFLMFFPSEKPVYVEEFTENEDCSYIALTNSGGRYTAYSKVSLGGKIFEAETHTVTDRSDELKFHRELQKCLKLSYYTAARAATGMEAPWGAVTGIRPVKIPTKLIESGLSCEEAEKVLREEYFVSPEKARLAVETAGMSIAAKKSLRKGDISLYIGIPFCPTRCSYCSFVSSSVEKSLNLLEPYLEALFTEMEAAARLIEETGLKIISIYIGGGTPTTLSAAMLDRLFANMRSCFELSDVREFTVEAGRADTVDEEKLRVIKAAGAGRISINPQTMNDSVLKVIGRKHTAQDVVKAFEAARKVGFDAINADLIAGLPTDTAQDFKESLKKVIALSPENITVHTLALKKGSKLTEGGFLPSESEVTEMLEISQRLLRKAGYKPYYLYRQKFTAGNFENLGWCREGRESLYNICIMEELQTIISLGGGGVTKLVAPECGRIERIFNAKYPYEYMASLDKEIKSKEYLKVFPQKYQ